MTDAWLDTLRETVINHPHWAGVLVFLTVFTESLAVIGVLVPGVAMMFVFGALSATGIMDWRSTLLWAIAGAISGDGLSYALGRYYQQGITRQWPFSRHPEMLVHGHEFFQRWGSFSVVIGRFFGPLRAVVPLVAGVLGMAPSRYLLANGLSACLWAPLYLSPGIVIGMTWQQSAELWWPIAAWGLVGALLLWALLRSLRWVLGRLKRRPAA